jgi:hypothetical protein
MSDGLLLSKTRSRRQDKKPGRIRSEQHLRWVASLPCAIAGCPNRDAQAHHLTCGPEPKARGLKASDCWVLPLCVIHHSALHMRGDERAWWASQNFEPLPCCALLWALSVAAGRWKGFQ